jgi:hypothetical protein
MIQRAFIASQDVSTYLASQTLPLGMKKSLNLIAWIESATREKRDGIRAEFSALTGEKLAGLAYELLENPLLENKQCEAVLTLIVEAIGSQHGMSQYERAAILKQIFRQYDSNKLDTNHFNYLIEKFFSSIPPTPNLAFSLMLDAYSNISNKLIEKIKNHNHEVIDDAIYQSVFRLGERFDSGASINKATTVLSFINLPKTLKFLCDSYSARGEEPLKIYLLSEMFSRNSLSKSYIEVFKSSMDIDVICETCANQNAKNIALLSAYNFIDEFGEVALFPQKIFDVHMSAMNDGSFPYYLHVMGYDDYDSDRLSLLSGFVLDNAATIYDVFTDDTSIEVKYGLLRIASAKNRVCDVLPYEIAHLRRLSRFPEGNFTFQQTLFELEAAKTVYYWNAIRNIDAIGLIEAEPFLRGINRKIFKDILDTVDLSKVDRKELFKVYPSSKGLFLEDDLGL